MRRLDSLPALVWAVLSFAAWRSGALLHAWEHSPMDRLGWLALVLWAFPAVLSLAVHDAPDQPPPRAHLLVASLLATLGGSIADLNAANYIGLALAVAAIPGASLRTFLWLGTAASWMPALSWLAQGLPRTYLVTGRLGLAAAGVMIALLPLPTLTSPRRTS